MHGENTDLLFRLTISLESVGLTVEYKDRRDFLIDSLSEEFHLKRTIGQQGVWKGMDVYEASANHRSLGIHAEKFEIGCKMFSFVPPTSGMFLWVNIHTIQNLRWLMFSQVTVHFDTLPSFTEGDEETLEMQLWTKLADAGVLVAPGWYFSPLPDPSENGEGHLRISFSNAEVSHIDFNLVVPA